MIQLPGLAHILSSKFHIPVAGLLHQYNYNPLKRKLNYSASLKERFIKRLMDNHAQWLKSFDKLFAISPSLAHNASLLLSTEVKIIHYGFDRSVYLADNIPPKNIDAVYLGRLIPTKGILRMIQIWRNVVSQNVGATLHIIGSGSDEYTHKIEALISNLNLQSNIKLVGPLVGGEKVEYLKRAKFMLFLSELESYADVVTEALACGVPVVANKLDAYKDRSNLCKQLYLFNKSDDSGVLNKIFSLIDDAPAVKMDWANVPTWDDFAETEERYIAELI